MKRSGGVSILLCFSLVSAVQAQNGSGDMTDSGDSFPLGALIGICVAGGVVLLTGLVIVCVCVVCCIWRRRRQKSVEICDTEGGKGRADDRRSTTNSVSSVTHSIANKLLSQKSKKKTSEQTHNPDLTSTANGYTDNSNPLYNSASIRHFPSPDDPDSPTNPDSIQDALISPDPFGSLSPRRLSLPYVEMQSAGSALNGMVYSRSMEDLAESVHYESIGARTSATLQPGSLSYSPPPSPLANSVPATRHQLLRPLTTPPPSPVSQPSHHHSPHISDREEEEEGGKGDDGYEDPQLFIEDQEKMQKEQEAAEDVSEAGYEEMRGEVITTFNRAYLNSNSSDTDNFQLREDFLPSKHHTTAASLLSAHQTSLTPVTGSPNLQPKAHGVRTPRSYEPREPSPLGRKLSVDNQYIEVVSPSPVLSRKFYSRGELSSDCETPKSASGAPEYKNLLEELGSGVTNSLTVQGSPSSGRKSPEQKSTSSTLAPDYLNMLEELGSGTAAASSLKVQGSPSGGRKTPVCEQKSTSSLLAPDYQNLLEELGSDAASSLKVQSSLSSGRKSPVCEQKSTSAPDYQNLLEELGSGVVGNGGRESSPTANSLTVQGSPSSTGGRKSPSRERRSTSPLLDGKRRGSPKPRLKPKPDLSPAPPANSKSHSVLSGAVTQKLARMALVSDSKSHRTQQRPHLEEMVFPTPVANGNGVVTKSNGADTTSNGIVATPAESRGRSATVPLDRGRIKEGEEDGEVFYINVDVGGQELYENVTHLSHLV